VGKTENRPWGSGTLKLEEISAVVKTTPKSVLSELSVASTSYRGPVFRNVAQSHCVFHKFFRSRLYIFVDFQINQVPSHSETESHIFLFVE